jgi:hypothetical protein
MKVIGNEVGLIENPVDYEIEGIGNVDDESLREEILEEMEEGPLSHKRKKTKDWNR